MIPRLPHHTAGTGEFRLGPATVLAADRATLGVAGWLRGVLAPATGCPLPAGPPGRDSIRLALHRDLPPAGYRLTVTPSAVDLRGGSPAGVFHGAQTLRLLLPPAALRRARTSAGPWPVPVLDVTDAPRFAWRGLMLDVARHFMPTAAVLRLIDLMALHKLNVLHLHLTDDQGWRLEIPAYPRLTEVSAWRAETMRGPRQHGRPDGRPHGGFYTADDIREIVSYARERHVEVVPEIDLPGHMQAVVAAYPELGNGGPPVRVMTGWGVSTRVLNVSDAALAFCRDVLDVVCALFPGRHVGIGGDECPKAEWRASPLAQARMRAHDLPDFEALQAWFVGRLAEHLHGHGRVVFGWDEILEGGAPAGATVAAWRGEYPALVAARAGHDVVVCPDTSVYLDYRQSDHPDEPVPVGTVVSLDDVYAFEPVPAGLTDAERERVIGAQCNVWTEHMDSPRTVDYMVFPRLCAFAERVWSAPGGDVADFRRRLTAHLPRLDALGVEYRPLDGPRPWQARPDVPGRPVSRGQREGDIAALTAVLRRQQAGRADRPAPPRPA